MKNFLFLYFSSLIIMFLIDFIWLSITTKSFYQKNLGHLLATSPSLLPALIFYLIFILGLVVLVLFPALNNDFSYLKIFLFGCLFGLVTYGTYDLTNQAMMKNWPVIVTLIDLTWGVFLTGTVSVIVKFLFNFFK